MQDNLLVQLGGILLTLIVTMLGIFKGLFPMLIDSFEKRLSDKDAFLQIQIQSLDSVMKERRETNDRLVESLQSIVTSNHEAMEKVAGTVDALKDRIVANSEAQQMINRQLIEAVQTCNKNQAKKQARQ